MPIIPTTMSLGRRAIASTPYPCQAAVPSTPPCWHAARVHTADRQVELALRSFHHHPPWPPPRRVQQEPTTTPTMISLGRKEFASTPNPFPVVVQSTLLSWHVARPRTADRLLGLASRVWSVHPPWHPPRLVREVPTITLTTASLGRMGSASTPNPFPVAVPSTLPIWHAARPRMVDRQVGLASRHSLIHPPWLPPRLVDRMPITPTTPLLGQKGSASTPFPCQVVVPSTLLSWLAASPRTLDSLVVLVSRVWSIHPPLLRLVHPPELQPAPPPRLRPALHLVHPPKLRPTNQ
jgi:hypothetical protein